MFYFFAMFLAVAVTFTEINRISLADFLLSHTSKVHRRQKLYVYHYPFVIPAKAFARIMESPAYVCLSVCLFVCLSVTTITK